MGADIPELLTGGGLVGFIGVVSYVLKLFVDYRREKSDDKHKGAVAQSHDASTVTALTMESLREERAENTRLQTRIDDLEKEVTTLRNELFALKHDYEDRLFEAQQEARTLQTQVQDLVRKLNLMALPPKEA